MARTTFATLDDVRAAVGRHLGTSRWVEVTAERVAAYGRATGDRDDTGGPATVPPLLVLALTNLFLPEIVEVLGASVGMNYGTGPVRFGQAVPVGSRLRGRADLVACVDVRGGIQTTMRVTVDVDGRDDPACVVEALSRWLE
jgi:acyl dehydratase